MKRLSISLVLILSVFIVGEAQAAINLGVMSPRGPIKALAQWSELGKYLEAELGQEVKIVPLNPAKTEAAVSAGEVHYMLSNPVLSLILMKKHGASSLVTLNRKVGSQFGGVIIAKKGAGITSAADLKGKSVLAYKFKKSAAAYVFQVKHLMDKGIDAHKDFKSFKESKRQDEIVLAVKNGLADVGFIKTGLLEAMQKEGKIKISDFEIIDRISDGFAHVHSTKLYPEWTITTLSGADKAVSEKLKVALLKLGGGVEASKKAKIEGFVEPASFADLESTLKALKLPPYQ